MSAAWEIAKREILDGVVTWKLPLAFALTVLLVLTGVATLSQEYEERAEGYALAQDEFESGGRDGTTEALAHRVLARPNPLGALVGGPAEDVRRAFAEPPQVTSTSVVPRVDPVRLRFSTADLAAVAVGTLTLAALLISYDAVAGEKERGTLKILLVNPLGRRDVLLGKYAGGLLGVGVPCVVAAVLAAVYLSSRGVPLGGAGYARLALVLVALLLLLSAFVLVGVAASALTTRSSVAVVTVLFAWLILVSGAGSLAAFAAGVDSPARAAGEVLAEARGIDAHYDALEDDLASAVRGLERKRADQNGTLSAEDALRLDALRRDLALVPAEREAAHDALLDAYLRGQEGELVLAERAAVASPAEAFRSVAQTLAGTDYGSARRQMDEFALYLREVREARDEHAALNTTEPFEPPPYRHAEPRVRTALAQATPALLALALENVVLFGVAAVAFARYDAR